VVGGLAALSLDRAWRKKETTFVRGSQAARRQAEAIFRQKELPVREGAKAVADQEAVDSDVEKKTARLKALRLAKEEAGRQAAAAKESGLPPLGVPNQ
jgi:hypothetical protein